MDAASRHHAEISRAAAAAMGKHYQETIDICSELLTSGVYEEIGLRDAALAKQLRAEARLMMATAMHYSDAHYEDIVRVLNSALDAPAATRKDVYFTLAVVHVSFAAVDEAQQALEHCLTLIAELRKRGESSPAMNEKEEDARQLLEMVNEQRAAQK